MAVGIRMADAVHTVSPTYSTEILRPSAVSSVAYYGGEGLEADLVAAKAEGRLHGFLNGCEYPPELPVTPDWTGLLDLMRTENLRWAGASAQVAGAHFVAHARLGELPATRPTALLTSVGRITSQKVRLLQESAGDGRPALEGVLDTIGEDGLLVMLGSGDPALEQFLAETSARRRNLLFLRGYSDRLAQALYGAGDLFLMPSSFEPCGISQMLAMRAGQSCLVHRVGGLRDTVKPGVNGFGFDGNTLTKQTDGLVTAVRDALALRANHSRRWHAMRKAAARARFRWRASAEACINLLYQAG
jgi:starch synthase